MEQNWLIHDGTGSLLCSSGWYLVFDHSEQSMDSHSQAYFHDRPNILLVQIDVKILSQEYNIYVIYTMLGKQG